MSFLLVLLQNMPVLKSENSPFKDSLSLSSSCSCASTTSLTERRVSTRSPATVELLNAGSGSTEDDVKA